MTRWKTTNAMRYATLLGILAAAVMDQGHAAQPKGKALLGTWMKQAQNDGELAIGFRITRINEQQQRQHTPVSCSDLGIFDWSSPNWHILIPTVHVNFTRGVYD